ncbi:hypothetical protein B0H17DRAFT_1124322 [Mycena rosella]|uniref:Transmembrane protein n=1 Tax=Mycena rosella TaxID=1033263 RepID=A0AAD7H1L4_MYCRO|nr:hypothetical protein B0H17DRAFT_1124322 [Mycena rosella]
MSQNVTFDDRDQSVLNYSPGWFLTGTYNATSVGQTGTLASSSITNVNVTFVFPTPATEFFYFGIKRCCGGSYLICIDCDPNDRKFITIDAVDPTDDGQSPPVVLFSQKFSVAGVHEVILMNQPDPAFGGNSQITLDRFELTVPDPNAVQPTSATSANLFSTPTPSSTAGPELVGSASSSSSNLAPILGGVLGGLVILLIIVGIWLLVRRRSRRTLYSEEQATAPGPQFQSQWRPNSTFTTLTTPGTTISTTTSRRELDAGRIYSTYTESADDPLPPEYGQVFNTAGPSESSSLEPPPPPLPLKASR